MRGQRIFKELIASDGLSIAGKKGRSDKLVARRNECLIARYYYYGYYKNKCYEEILSLLASEFFISQIRISQLILENSEQAQVLKEKKPSLTYFTYRWGHLKW
jgi:hypothetical protein